jgi:hypothetical protein
LQLSDNEATAWFAELPSLLDKADQGRRAVEAALLFDLQKICLDHEREVYALDLVEWLLSAGRRPIKRPLPSQRLVRIARHLRTAAARVPRTRLASGGRRSLADLLAAALRRNEERLRARFRVVLVDALQDVGLHPADASDRVAFQKMVEELLDRITGFGFLTFGDLRDTISRNRLKLPDLAEPEQFLRGDPLIRLDRRLATLLDGVYHPSEFYLRWLERFTSLNFGTAAGRFLTRYVTLPFGIAFVLTEGLQLLLGEVSDVELGPTVQILLVLCLGFLLLSVLRFETVQRAVVQTFIRAGQAGRYLLLEMPSRVLPVAALRRVLTYWPLRLSLKYLLKPALICGLLCYYLPEAFTNLLSAAGIFLACNFVLNSRLGEALEEAVLLLLARLYDLLRAGLLPVLLRLVLQLFKQIVDAVDYILFSVDEWLRFRSGDSLASLVLRTGLGVLWFPISYVARFYMIVLIEPGLNPIKFPISSLGAKFIYPFGVPLTGMLAGMLAPVVGTILANVMAGTTVWLLPDAFGFLFWEMKENWSLYRANRSPILRPIAVGPHGETVVQLLRPGFHSGTLARIFARLRRAQHSDASAGPTRVLEACQHELHEVERALRLFVTRELFWRLELDPRWQQCRLDVGPITLSSNHIEIPLLLPADAPRPLLLRFEEREHWLVAGIPQAGWLENLTASQRQSLAAALASLYKLAGVDLVHEQIQAQLGEPLACYEITETKLLVWRDSPDGQVGAYDLTSTELVLSPKAADGTLVPAWPVVDAGRVLFARTRVFWRTDEPHEAKDRVEAEPMCSLLPAPESARATPG